MLNRHFLASLAATALIVPVASVQAADHLDAPGVMGMPQADINDLYAFQSPNNPNNSVLILTVNPGAGGAVSPTDQFGTNINYDILIDNNGDSIADLNYRTTFTNNTGGGQTFTTTRSQGGVNSVLATGNTGSNVATTNGGTATAGVFDDPFFFDFSGFNDGFNFTGDDFFAGLNTNAIVIELPSADLGNNNVGVFATTSQDGAQVDQIGRPGINTVLIGSGRKDAFNQTLPADQFADFGAEVAARIAELNGGDTATADAITAILLPDLLTFDSSSADGFLNGRRLTDDVIDAELALLTNGALTTDGVDSNDVAFSSLFPYLAPRQGGDDGGPSVIPTPSAALAGLGLMGLLAARRRRADEA